LNIGSIISQMLMVTIKVTCTEFDGIS